MNKIDEKRIILNSYIALVDFLSKVLGNYCEVVLHDVSDSRQSIIAISDNKLTGRRIGGTMSDIAQKVLELNQNSDYIINNAEKHFEGKDLRSNTFFIKNSAGELIGTLCVNFDISAPLAARKILDELIGGLNNDSDFPNPEFNRSIEEYTLDLIKNVLEKSDIPPERMTPDEKKDIIRQLNEKGVFRIKGGVYDVSRYLDISEATIYRYLKEIK